MAADRTAADLFAGPGELRALCRELDWSATPIGAVSGWPEALCVVVQACLESSFPICLWCGPELVLVYNDAYRSSLILKHPWALGRRGSDVWAETWDSVGPLMDQVMSGGPAV